jgi:DNA invertase Pin-like site-specific DNA recombinase
MQKYVIALYIRLSIEDTKYDSLSIENQHLVLNEYASSMPEAMNAEILEFIDNGYTGTNFERPKVQELIEMVRENKIDCIIVKDFSRFGRNSIETGYFIERVFPLFHTRFISISDDFDSNRYKGDTGGMDVAFKYLINEYYSRDMSIKTKSAKYAKMQRGEYQSKICPFGYRKSADGRMEPDPETAPVVRHIFELAVQGFGATQIAKKLYQEGIPTPGEYKNAHGNHTHDVSRAHGIWSASTVLRTLDDERYIGTYIIGKKAVTEVGGSRVKTKDRDKWFIIPDHHPALVDKETFEKAGSKITRFSQPHKQKREYPLRGKVFCGNCAHALSRIPKKTPVFVCRHSQADESYACYNLSITADELEEAVFTTLKTHLAVFANSDADGSKPFMFVAEKAAYEQQIEALQKEKQSLFERFVMDEISEELFKSEKKLCDDQLLKAKNAYAAITALATQQQEEKEQNSSRQAAANTVLNADALTPEIIDLLIDRVTVFPDKRIEITYKIQDFNA